MGTVFIERYRVMCPGCGFEKTFMIGGGMGSIHAVKVASRLHADVRVLPQLHKVLGVP